LSSRTTPGLSLFCFTILGSPGAGTKLIQHQITSHGGIAQCDEYMVFAPERVEIADGVWSVPLASRSTGEAGSSRQGQPNAFAFAAAWAFVRDHYIWRVHDWIAFVDPHTVFFPNQLRASLRGKAEAFEVWDEGRGIYLRTCAHTDSTYNLSGAMQLVSHRGFVILNFQPRPDPKSGRQSGVEWLQQWLDSARLLGVSMPGLLVDKYCEGDRSEAWEDNCNFSKVAYHPVASADAYRKCNDHAEAIAFK